jgi:hypothetical protein
MIFVGLILVALGQFTDSIDKIWSFIEKRSLGSESSPQSELHPPPSVLLPENLNVLVFDAANDPNAYTRFVRTLRREYPGIAVQSSSAWVNRYEMESSLIFYQGEDNRIYAFQLSDWFPGLQEVRDYQAKPGGFFGFSPERDLVIFLGNDWPGILQALGERPTQAVERTDAALARGPAAHRE